MTHTTQIGMLTVIIVGTLALSAIPAQAQGPYYAKPAWDQTLACTTTANCPRFIVLSNMSSQAVLDRETGLVWEQAPVGEGEWTIWQNVCGTKMVGGRFGWRLPTLQEAYSLIDASAKLPAGHPFSNIGSTFFWTATEFLQDTTKAYLMTFFGDGHILRDKGEIHGGWCVRGGSGSPAQ